MSLRLSLLVSLSALALGACVFENDGSSDSSSSTKAASSSSVSSSSIASSSSALAGIEGLSVEWSDAGYMVYGELTLPSDQAIDVVAWLDGAEVALNMDSDPGDVSFVNLADYGTYLSDYDVCIGVCELTLAVIGVDGDTLAIASTSFDGYEEEPASLVELTDSLVLGAKDASEGSSVDLDSWTVYKASEITIDNDSSIDLVFFNDATLGLMVGTTATALVSDAADVGASLQAKLVDNDVFFLDITSLGWDSLSVDALTEAVSNSSESDYLYFAAATEGNIYLVSTDMGFVIVRVNSVSGSGSSATISIKGLALVE